MLSSTACRTDDLTDCVPTKTVMTPSIDYFSQKNLEQIQDLNLVEYTGR